MYEPKPVKRLMNIYQVKGIYLKEHSWQVIILRKIRQVMYRLLCVACIYVCIMLMFKVGRLNLNIPEYVGRLISNTFSPASIYDKQLYSMDEEKSIAEILFGSAFSIINFMEAETETGKERYYEYSYELISEEVTASDVTAEAEEIITETDAAESEAEDSSENTTEYVSENMEENASENTIKEDNGSVTESREASASIAWVRKRILEISPLAYSIEQLMDYDFVHDSFYVIPEHTSLTEEYLNPEQFLNTDLSVPAGEQPCVLIYHTHSQETFADSTGDNMSIVQVGDYLEKILTEEYGYKVIHVTTEFDMKDGVLDRSKAYTYAEPEIAAVLADNPDVDLVIDLHRDGVNENTHLVTEINGKQVAKVMLFNGISYSDNQGHIDYLDNPYISDNLALTYQMYALGKTYYPDFFRCIYIEAYRYNLHLCRRSMLIEAGAQTNTFQEVLNAMEPLAELIDRELSGEMNLY